MVHFDVVNNLPLSQPSGFVLDDIQWLKYHEIIGLWQEQGGFARSRHSTLGLLSVHFAVIKRMI